MGNSKYWISGAVVASLFATGAFLTFNHFDQIQKETIPVLRTKKEIPPRTQITMDMFKNGTIEIVNLPANSVPPNTFRNPNEIAGKYTKTNAAVPQFSFLYHGKVLSPKEITDGASFLLKEGEKMMAIEVNIKTSIAAQIVEGSYINLWFIGEDPGQDETEEEEAIKGGPVVGPFLDKVRIIGIYTTTKSKISNTGIDTPEQDEESENPNNVLGANIIPQTILLAVTDEQAGLIQLAQSLGEINVLGLAESPKYEDKLKEQEDIAKTKDTDPTKIAENQKEQKEKEQQEKKKQQQIINDHKSARESLKKMITQINSLPKSKWTPEEKKEIASLIINLKNELNVKIDEQWSPEHTQTWLKAQMSQCFRVKDILQSESDKKNSKESKNTKETKSNSNSKLEKDASKNTTLSDPCEKIMNTGKQNSEGVKKK